MSDIDMQKRKLLLQDFQNGVPVSEATINVAKQLGKKGFSARTCQRWYQKFKTGDFDINEKPIDERIGKSKRLSAEATKTSTSVKITRSAQKQVTVDAVTFKNNQKKPECTMLSQEAMQTLVNKKAELTISKVVGGAVMHKERLRPNILTKRLIAPTIQMNSAKQSAAPAMMSPSARIANGPFNVKLPINIAKRLKSLQTSAEKHTIGEGRKSSQKSGQTTKKTITVQFENVSPALAKNTVRKVAAKAQTPIANKRLSVPQSTPLGLPKGVIYLNPQEIFTQSFGFQNTLQKAVHVSPFPKAVSNLPKTPTTVRPVVRGPQRLSQSPLTVSDSDSEDDIVFPANISVPPPKVKALAETFTTYWDMETNKPILLNPAEDMVPLLPPVIEID